MKTQIRQLILMGIVTVPLFACGQSQDGPAEQAGEKLDKSIEQMKDSTGKAIDRAGEKLEQGGDKVREKTEHN